MKMLDASPDSSFHVWDSVCPPPPGGKLPKRKQINDKEFQEMIDNVDSEVGVGGGEKKRRLSVDQVKALERSFEKENKLEHMRKNRLAQDLGLHPRQVAIWFQNRRARWKTKQLERDYGVLKSDYGSLRTDYDSLENENKSLISQLTELKLKLRQQVRAAENNLLCDDSRVKESGEEDDLNLLIAEADAIMHMCSPTSVSSFDPNNASTASSDSWCTTAVFSRFQGLDSRAGKSEQ